MRANNTATGWRIGRGTLLLTLLLALVSPAAWGDVYVQMPPDTDGVDTDGDGIVDNDHVFLHLAAGDGFSRMADGRSLYVFGFADATGVNDNMVMHQYMLGASIPAPTITVREGQRLYLTLTNVGMMLRPDLFDPHTVHWHGFDEAGSVFDGVPDASISVNMGSSLTYFYIPVWPGTYMYHCHVEALEHMQMGMLGNLYVLPQQDLLPNGTDLNGFTHEDGFTYAYNDEDGSTYYDVDYALQMGSFDPVFHDASRDVQPLPFAEMVDTYFLINGRGYPDTMSAAPLVNEMGRASQGIDSRITAQPGEKILLRLSNLSTTDYFTVTALGLPMHVVGRDARLLRGPDGADMTYMTTSVTLGGGEAADVIIDTTGIPEGTYFLYSTNLNQLCNDTQDYGGAMTEILIGAAATDNEYLQATMPANGSDAALDTPVEFVWTYSGPRTLAYTLQIAAQPSDLGGAMGLAFAAGAGTDYTLTAGELAQLTAYLDAAGVGSFYWRVSGNDGGTAAISAANLVTGPDGLIMLLDPLATQSAYEPPSFDWDYQGDTITNFWVQVSPDPDFGRGSFITRRSTTATGMTLTDAEWRRVKRWFRREEDPNNWIVYWRVIGRMSPRARRNDPMLLSAVGQFTIDGGVVTLTAPADGSPASLAGAPPVMTFTDSIDPWPQTGAIGKYVLEMCASMDFTGRVYRTPLRGTSQQEITAATAAAWPRLPRRLGVNLNGGPVLVYWRIVAQDSGRILKMPSAQVWSIELAE